MKRVVSTTTRLGVRRSMSRDHIKPPFIVRRGTSDTDRWSIDCLVITAETFLVRRRAALITGQSTLGYSSTRGV